MKTINLLFTFIEEQQNDLDCFLLDFYIVIFYCASKQNTWVVVVSNIAKLVVYGVAINSHNVDFLAVAHWKVL